VGLGDLLYRSVCITGFWVTEWLHGLGPDKLPTLAALMDLLAQGVILPHSGALPVRCLPPALACTAHAGRAARFGPCACVALVQCAGRCTCGDAEQPKCRLVDRGSSKAALLLKWGSC
jgi:hypothetical protein